MATQPVSIRDILTLLDHSVLSVDDADPKAEAKLALLAAIRDTYRHELGGYLGIDVEDPIELCELYDEAFAEVASR